MPTQPVLPGDMDYPDEIPSFQPVNESRVRAIIREELGELVVEPVRSPVFESVVHDLRERDRIGFERFGRPMVAGDGNRDALREAYEEALDMVVYLREELEIRDAS